MQNLYNDLAKLLEKDERLFAEGKVLKNKVTELAIKLDRELLKLLLQNKQIKEHFFVEAEEILVFDQDKFVKFVNNKEFLPNSFTIFKNRIGLVEGDEYLIDSGKVVLAWPYKDCVLEGGQEKEEDKRNEIFYNEILAPDEIDCLFEPKVLTNFKKIDKDGEHKIEQITEQDNLIIKGNNLLALHSIEKKYRGKVKLIYIDPPYNTGNDGFNYNDSFNHSTWLTFMKNRLEIARELLSNDGVIFISINHIELGYLSILLDEIFDRENKLPIITLKAGTTASYRSINDCPVNVTEYVLAYSKSSNFKPNPIYRETGYSEDYSHFIENFEGQSQNWKLTKLADFVHSQHGCNSWREYKKKIGANWKRKRFEEMEEFAFQNKDRVVSLNTLQKPSQKIQQVINQSKEMRDKVFSVEREDTRSIYCFNGRTLAFFGSKFRKIEGDLVPAEILTNLWSDISFLGIGPEGGVTLENGKKPEYLLKTIIELITEKNDIVLDYHLGSGTTAAVAHKMGRQYIGIEQLDYDENDSVVRLNNVIRGDKSGISELDDIKWQGGGDFVYMELKRWNEDYMQAIQEAKTTKEIVTVYKKMQQESFFRYEIDLSKFDQKQFSELTLEDQKKVLLECLDKNHLYVNYSEIEDTTYKIPAEEKRINKQFYGN